MLSEFSLSLHSFRHFRVYFRHYYAMLHFAIAYLPVSPLFRHAIGFTLFRQLIFRHFRCRFRRRHYSIDIDIIAHFDFIDADGRAASFQPLFHASPATISPATPADTPRRHHCRHSQPPFFAPHYYAALFSFAMLSADRPDYGWLATLIVSPPLIPPC
jgi:hypothetical protein